MNGPAEAWAGARLGRRRSRAWARRASAGSVHAGRSPSRPLGAGGGGRGRGARPPMTPEQQEAQKKAAAALKDWRLSVSMDKYKALRKLYNDAGVKIYAFKFGADDGHVGR